MTDVKWVFVKTSLDACLSSAQDTRLYNTGVGVIVFPLLIGPFLLGLFLGGSRRLLLVFFKFQPLHLCLKKSFISLAIKSTCLNPCLIILFFHIMSMGWYIIFITWSMRRSMFPCPNVSWGNSSNSLSLLINMVYGPRLNKVPT